MQVTATESSRRGFSRFRGRVDAPSEGDPLSMRLVPPAKARGGEFVLYWCHSYHRFEDNLAFDFAVRQANSASLPLVVAETIDVSDAGVTPRKVQFVLDGFERNNRDATKRGATHLFLHSSASREDLLRLVERSALVVTDDYPTRPVRELVRDVTRDQPIATVDDNGIFPVRASSKEHYSARFFRDFANRTADTFFFTGRLPGEMVRARLKTPLFGMEGDSSPVASDESGRVEGGRVAALATLARFIDRSLTDYSGDRNRRTESSSGLSPFLRWGFLSVREVARAVLSSSAPDEDVDAFLEQLIIRRELAFNLCHFNEQHDSLAALPAWAVRTLDNHRGDRRSPAYSFDQLECASSADEVWNAAQRELLTTGTIHNYLRMVWGKRIIEWSATPEEAHATMLRLHERYAIDAVDPNTHAGILWCFGKHDRPWFPERPVFGTIRFMSSEAAKKKIAWRDYVRRFGSGEAP